MTDIEYFLLLKNKVASVFLIENIASSIDISEWKGKDIAKFQDSLLDKVKTQVSEKWFYTYFKNDSLEKIPRIDMLNILCMYAGYKDWVNFKSIVLTNNSDETNLEITDSELTTNSNIVNIVKEEDFDKQFIQPSINRKQNKDSLFFKNKKLIFSLLVFFWLSLGIGALFLLEILPLKYTYQFNFIDSDRNKLVNSNLEYTIIRENQSPIHFKGDKSGIFKIKSKENKIQLIVSSPYYKKDTIIREINSKYHTENVLLKTDDYALMLHYLSNSKVEDWRRRRRELNKLIANNAIIYQVYGDESYGVDILTKQDFINKLTLPTSSLKNLNIIETQKKNNKITKLKFEIIPYEN